MIYQQFGTSDIVAGRTQTVSSGFFNDGNYSVAQSSTTFTTSAFQTQTAGSGNYNYLNGLYYWNVYYNNQVHFSLAYGDLVGSGSSANDINITKVYPFEANYQSYVNLLLSPTETQFSFLSGSYNTSTKTLSTSTLTNPAIFIINFGANLYKNQVDAGQLQFSLKGAYKSCTFIDDSSVINKVSNVYNIIQGTISNGIPTPVKDSSGLVNYTGLGLFYPKNGVVILNATALSNLIGPMTGGIYSDNTSGVTYPNTTMGGTDTFALYQSCLYNSLISATGTFMNVRKSELIPTTQYYVRVQNSNFNYTNNPTFVSDGTDGLVRGTIKIPSLRTNPTTYITTIGLYDANNELVAVAKVSNPVAKSFDNEYLIKVSLAY